MEDSSSPPLPLLGETSLDEPSSGEAKPGSKNQAKIKLKLEKNIRNKRAHGVTVIMKQEEAKNYESLFSDALATPYLAVLHGGSGDEDDQSLVSGICASAGAEVLSLDIIPGNCFGVVAFASSASAQAVM